MAAQTRANGRIAFNQVTQGSDSQIYLMGADGGGPTLVPTSCHTNHRPRWSPDGTQVVFVSSCPSGNDEIYTMNVDGSDLRRLTNNNWRDGQPAWSPDGTKIAFVSDRGFETRIFVMNADGADQRRLTTDLAGETSPDWSPDGRRIAYSRLQPGVQSNGVSHPPEIYLVNADGSNPTNLTSDPGHDYQPAWSPDGGRIAFSSLRGANQNIYVMGADGANQTKLTALGGDANPSWSPDGAKIVFSSIVNGNDDLYVMNRDGSNQVRITNSPIHESFPAWQPMLAPAFAPTLITEGGSARAVALDSVTLMRDPFPVVNAFNFSPDGRTRVTLFAVYAKLKAGESASAITAQAKDARGQVFPLDVEYVGQAPTLVWLTQINVRLPEGLAGEVGLTINLRGVASNEATVRVE